MQIAEWDKAESDLDENDIFDMEESEDAAGTTGSWTGALLKTSLGGFLHGLTGTKVCPPSMCLREDYLLKLVVLGDRYAPPGGFPKGANLQVTSRSISTLLKKSWHCRQHG